MIYKFKLIAGDNSIQAHPVYKKDMSLDYEHESQQQFFRAKLSGNLSFLRNDADFIINAPFETEFILQIQRSLNLGITWEDFYEAIFYKTDCIINIDDRKVTVKPQVRDRYKAILDGLDNEYNLIKLLPVTESVRMTKRSVIQIYGRGDRVVTNLYGGLSWEQDFDIIDRNPEEFQFDKCSETVEMTFDNPPSGLEGLFSGLSDEFGNFTLHNGADIYYVERYHRGSVSGGMTITEVRRTSDNEVVWFNNGDDSISDLTFTDGGYNPQYIHASGFSTAIYARLLLDREEITIDGQTYRASRIQTYDPSYGHNYAFCIKYKTNNLIQSNVLSSTPTEWGHKNPDEYFDKPDNVHTYFPVARSLWVNYSMWYYMSSEDYYIEERARKEYYMRNAYPLWTVLDVLLKKIAPDIEFKGTSEYSEFFYGSNNPLDSSYTAKPFIVPKSNILKGEYNEPAMKAPITLSSIFDMLKNAFACYWFIDNNNRLRIEHISWFKNGGSYTAAHFVEFDITSIIALNNGKKWSFCTNTYEFDKEDMPSRYQYKWMDDVTEVFEGSPYQITSAFTKSGNVEDITISDFTSDIDYMLIAPESCSKDGFALLMANRENNENYIPIEVRGVQPVFVIQNYYASMMELQRIFLNWDLPSWNYEIDNRNRVANGIQRNKVQQITFPAGYRLPDTTKLLRTELGDGQIEKISINLSSGIAKATLKYDTYAL